MEIPIEIVDKIIMNQRPTYPYIEEINERKDEFDDKYEDWCSEGLYQFYDYFRVYAVHHYFNERHKLGYYFNYM